MNGTWGNVCVCVCLCASVYPLMLADPSICFVLFCSVLVIVYAHHSYEKRDNDVCDSNGMRISQSSAETTTNLNVFGGSFIHSFIPVQVILLWMDAKCTIRRWRRMRSWQRRKPYSKQRYTAIHTKGEFKEMKKRNPYLLSCSFNRT